ncbi:hypothetical protein OIO90_005894 [Microbotryomycetes sp. JL221]|nr:hypothetical protein OIO90_005894 [Microbotryomycetes sp. JL221]
MLRAVGRVRQRHGSTLTWIVVMIAWCSVFELTSAHAHHDQDTGPYEQNFLNDKPIDATLKWHIAIQALCWGLVFPAGMILGITKSPLHVPLQLLGIVLSLFVGNSLGHHHGGRSFHSTAHMYASRYMWWYLVLQTCFGIFLKLHLCQGTKLRRTIVIAHGIVGKSFPVVGWAQMILGGIASLGFCFNDHFGQCLAHFLMGSAFIGYAFILLIMLRLGAEWLNKRNWSQEFLDSWVIMVWGIINTFTEHDFLSTSGHWSHKDMQHVSLGVLWWAGGALGIFLGRNAQRNVIPGLIMTMTGYAMSAHEQSTQFSTTIHWLFGICLMCSGISRIIEIVFILKDQPTPSLSSTSKRLKSSFQHLPTYLLTLSGLTFLSATEEQMRWIGSEIGMDPTTYANILFSTAFILYLVPNGLIELYELTKKQKDERDQIREIGDVEQAVVNHSNSMTGWRNLFNGSVRNVFPGTGRSLSSGNNIGSIVTSGAGGVEMRDRHYESVPLSLAGAASVGRHNRSTTGDSDFNQGQRPTSEDDRRVFELGDEEDDGGDAYWDEDDSGGSSNSSRLRTTNRA